MKAAVMSLQRTESFWDVCRVSKHIGSRAENIQAANVITVKLTQPVRLSRLFCVTATLWRHLQPAIDLTAFNCLLSIVFRRRGLFKEQSSDTT